MSAKSVRKPWEGACLTKLGIACGSCCWAGRRPESSAGQYWRSKRPGTTTIEVKDTRALDLLLADTVVARSGGAE
jgi:hypothetical protein